MRNNMAEPSNTATALGIEKGKNGLDVIRISTDAAEAEIYLNGAHVTQWQPRDAKPILWMSESSLFQAGKAIRGGVPLIFPWFGARAGHPQSPAHGFARTLPWEVVKLSKTDNHQAQVVLALKSSAQTRSIWPQDFALKYTVTVGTQLTLELEVTNTGGEAFTFEEAMHTYLAVGDARQVSVHGLEDTIFIDKVQQMARRVQTDEPVTITGETDRVYLNTRAACVLKDPVWARTLIVEKSHSDATVIWNPWIAKAKAMSDFGDDEWPHMICIETCNVADHQVTLPPGASHKMTARILQGA